MSNLLNAADVLDREALRFKELTAAAEQLRAIGSLEQASVEINRRCAELRAQESLALARLNDVNGQIERDLALAQENIGKAKREAEDILRKAKSDAMSVVEAGVHDAQAITDKANAEAEKVIAAAQKSAQEAAQRKSDLCALADEAKARRDAAVAAAEAAEVRLAAAQAEIKRLLGG